MSDLRLFIISNPWIIDLLMAAIIWPTITAFASLFQGWLAVKFPKLWGQLQTNGWDLLGAIRRARGLQKQTETPKDAPVVEAKAAVLKLEVAKEAAATVDPVVLTEQLVKKEDTK